MENSKILDELIKGSVDEMVFGECIYQITTDGIRNIPFNSEEYWRLKDEMDSPDAEIIEETYINIEDTIAKYKEYLTEEEINKLREYGK